MNDDRITCRQLSRLTDGRDRPAAHAIENAARGVNAAESTIRQTAAMIRAKLAGIEQHKFCVIGANRPNACYEFT